MISLIELRVARKILGVNCHASKTEIKTAFRKKAVQSHPDRYQGKDKPFRVREKWNNLINAYRLLMSYESPAQRNRYSGYVRSAKVGKVALSRQQQ